jgi:hypothetical protein
MTAAVITAAITATAASVTGGSSVVLSNLAYLIGAVLLAIIFGLLVWLRHRKPKSIDANVESFNRGLRALAPDRDTAPRKRGHAPTRAIRAPVAQTPLPMRSVRLAPSRPVEVNPELMEPTGPTGEQTPVPDDHGVAAEAPAERAGAEPG